MSNTRKLSSQENGPPPSASATLTRPGKWDMHFKDWIDQTEATGTDPNDVGDQAWANDGLKTTLGKFYLSYVSSDSTVLELGPGTGRVTRHLIGRCKRIELIDNSQFVVDWMKSYLNGKCEHAVHLIHTPLFPDIPSKTVDFVLAHGVMEHLDFDELSYFLDEFFRVVRPGGHVSFNYNTLHNDAGVAWFRGHRKGPGRRDIFRFYMPEFMQRLGELAGFEITVSHTPEFRLAHIVLRKPVA